MKKSTHIIIFFVSLLFSASTVFGTEAQLPVKAKILQCGKRVQLEQSCRADERCCPLFEMAKAQGSLDSSQGSYQVSRR